MSRLRERAQAEVRWYYFGIQQRGKRILLGSEWEGAGSGSVLMHFGGELRRGPRPRRIERWFLKDTTG